jgi:hypothetical protein
LAWTIEAELFHLRAKGKRGGKGKTGRRNAPFEI